jgi:hypothetical protein
MALGRHGGCHAEDQRCDCREGQGSLVSQNLLLPLLGPGSQVLIPPVALAAMLSAQFS